MPQDWSTVDLSRFWKDKPTPAGERARKKHEDELERERIRASGALPPAIQTHWDPEKGGMVADVDWSVALTKAKSVADSVLNRVGQTAINVGPVAAARTIEIAKPKPPSRFAHLSPRASSPIGAGPAQREAAQQAPVAPPPEWMDNAIGVLDAYAKESSDRLPKPDPRLEGDFWWDQVPQGAASVATMIGAGGLGALFRASPAVVGAVTSALDEAGSTYTQAKARLDAKVARGEITPAEAERRGSLAWVGGLPIGAADMLPVAHIFERSNKALGGALGRVARKMGLGGPLFETGVQAVGGGLEEGLTEMGQGALENGLQGLVTDDEIEWLKGVQEQGEIGGIVGTGLAAMLGAAKALRMRELAQEAGQVPRGTPGAPTEQAPALPQEAVQAPGQPVAAEPGPAPDLVPGVGMAGTERVGQAAQVEIPPEVRAMAQQHPTVQSFVQHMEAAGGLAPQEAQKLVASAKPAGGAAGEIARKFGTQAFTVQREGGAPLPAYGYMGHDGSIVLDEALDEKTAGLQTLWHEIGHFAKKAVGPEWLGLRDELERDFTPLMDQWRVEQEGLQAGIGRDHDSVVQDAMARGLSKEQAEAHYSDLIREESVSQAAEEAAGFITWALSDRSRLETLLTQARKGDRPTFIQRVLDLFRKAMHAVGLGQGTAQQQLDLLARTVSAGQWESMNPRQAAELAGRFVKLADAMVAQASKGPTQVPTSPTQAAEAPSSPVRERRQAAQPVAQERRQRPHSYAEALTEDIAQGRAETEAAVSELEREAEGLPEEITGGTYQEAAQPAKGAPIPEDIQRAAETMKARRTTKALRFLDALRTITGTPAEADIRLEDVSVADLRKAIYTADPNGPRNRSGVDLRRRASEFLQRAYLDTADALEAKAPTEAERQQKSAQRSKAAAERLAGRRQRVADGLEGDFRSFVRAMGGLANPEGHFDAYTSKEQGRKGGLFGGSPIAFPKGSNKGSSYEQIRDAAVEVGYFPGLGMRDVGLQDVLDALDSNPPAPGKLGDVAAAEAMRHYQSEAAAEQAYYDALSPEERAAADAFLAERQRQAEEGVPFEDRFRPADAFHGTPHEFERFSTEHIGTGEGAQAYGWGLYFASQQEVADYYRNTVGHTTWMLDGKPLNSGATLTPFGRERTRLTMSLMNIPRPDVKNIRAALDEEVASLRKHATFARNVYGDVIASMYEDKAGQIEQAADRITAKRGATLKVRLAPNDDEWLLWDEPLSKQSEKVREGLAKLGVTGPPPPETWEAYEVQEGDDFPTASPGDWIAVIRAPGGGVRGWGGTTFVSRDGAEKNARTRNEIGERPGKQDGRKIYEGLAEGRFVPGASTRFGQHAASTDLRSVGIRGIKYLDGSSRGRGEGSYNYVVFDAKDVEIQDRFSPARGDPVDPRGGPWFSAVSRVVAKMPQPKMQGDAARAWIGKQPGVTAEELDYLGLPDFLASKPSVTQQELLEFVEAHRVRVEETLHTEPGMGEGDFTKYARYTLPGGENYRELLLTWNPPGPELTAEQRAENEAAAERIIALLAPINARLEPLHQRRVEIEAQPIRDDELPEPEIVEVQGSPLDEVKLVIPDDGKLIGRIYRVPNSNDWVVQTATGIPQGTLQNKQHAIDLAATNWTQSQRREYVRTQRLREVGRKLHDLNLEAERIRAENALPHRVEQAPSYRSSHWSTPNVLAHLRTKDRVTAQGEPTLFVEEVQSDWHQAGRDEGYGAEPRWLVMRHLSATQSEMVESHASPEAAERAAEQWRSEGRNRAGVTYSVERNDRMRVPDAPFKQTWGALALKRAIKWAVDHGKSVVAWTTGTQQADRWNQQLHEHVESLHWVGYDNTDAADSSASIGVEARGANGERLWASSFDVQTGIEDGNHTEASLASYVGRENAEKILAAARAGEDGGVVSGLDLTIGAEGFRYFYDQALVQAANRLGKRYGAKVESGEVRGAIRGDAGPWLLNAHVFRIPPAMAETIKAEGFSTFADKFSPRADEERAIGPTPLGGSFADREEGFWQRLNRRVMYEFAPVARAQAGVLAEGGTVTPESDVAKKQTLYESKRAEDVRAIRQEQRKLVRLLKRAGIKLDEFDDYLRALHAPRRNDLMAERHPGAFNPLYNPGAGSTTRGARLTPNVIRDILSTVEADPRAAAFRQGAALVHAVNEAALQQRVDQGLLSREGAETWREQFGPEYVPLRSAELESQDGLPFVQGTGFQVPKRLSKRAEGRRTASGSPTVWSFAQAEEVASWARRNEVGLSMANLVRANPIPGLWRVSDTPTTQDGKPVEASDGKVQAFRFKERGDDRYIVFEGPTGVQLAETMKRLGVEKTGSLVKYLGGVGRVFTRLATQWNPEFLLRNLVKDVPTALIRTVAVQGWKAGARTGASIPMAIRGIRQVLQAETAGKEPPHGYWQDRFVEFRKAGGKTGYTSLQDYQSRAEDFGKALERGNVAELARTVWAAYENLQEAVEAGTRLAVYDTSLRHGMSQEDAAVQAREVTVDFNRKGELTPVLNSLYWFFNPSVQGSRMVLKTLGTPRGAALGGAVAALGYILANFNRWIGQDDDDKRNRWDETSDWLKNGYLQVLLPGMVDVPLPGGRKLSIDRVMAPLPWGYSMLFSAGLHAAETQARAEDPTAALGHVMAAATESFNPMGASPTPAQFVSPSLIDPFVQLTENRSFTGSAIRPENPYGQKAPSEVYWPDVNESARELTHWLNQITGGNKREAGRVSISPEDLEHLVQSYTGGGGQFLERAFKAAQNIAAGGEVETREVPFLRSFAAEPDERTMQSQYRRAVNRVRTTDQVQRLDQGAPQRPELLELVQTAKEYEKEIEDLEEAGLTEQANARRREFLKLYRSTLNPEPVR